MIYPVKLMGVLILGIPCIYWDLKKKEVPLFHILACTAFFFLVNFTMNWLSLLEMAIGAFVGLIILFISIFTKEKVGKGDAVLFISIGIWSGGYALLSIGVLSCLLGAVTGVILVIKKKMTFRETLPFTPFILFSALVEVCLQWITKGLG